MMTRSAATAIATVLLLVTAQAARAQDRPPADAMGDGADSTQQANATGIFAGSAVSESALQASAGREDVTQLSQADLQAEVAGNSVGDNAVTGTAQIDGNAFQNMSGLSILNINTGNNVAINAAMNVNISITPGP